ncbi:MULTISPECIES: hypothetical protein [Prosthecochloris]|uniref:Ferritin-like domain-containing protein n=1 Tax=Prosthecochloris vibrioformis TaxID=1098 RepID=A0A5C4S0H3_PROVB|nr:MULTISPECIES: hypothetical protein [Prosthecochloris]ANT65017.1 hypothetical protein Ptc2401_01244 [Prosthecochloris sp. CIB 2401]TNJ36914.1 hypothetical protein FGF68_04900 [Prosthecochloris vibrioformis]
MFTNEAYKTYLLQIQELEQRMVRESWELSEKIDDPEIKEFMLHIMRDEERHVGYVQEMMRILDEQG